MHRHVWIAAEALALMVAMCHGCVEGAHASMAGFPQDFWASSVDRRPTRPIFV